MQVNTMLFQIEWNAFNATLGDFRPIALHLLVLIAI